MKWLVSLCKSPSSNITDATGSTPIAIVDRSGCLVAILAGRPDAKNWAQLPQQVAVALEEWHSRCYVPHNKCKHRCGHFVALQCGISYGSRQRWPCNMSNNWLNEKILNKLNELEPFKQNAAFASGKSAQAFFFFMEKLLIISC